MADLNDGESLEMNGSGAKPYVLDCCGEMVLRIFSWHESAAKRNLVEYGPERGDG